MFRLRGKGFPRAAGRAGRRPRARRRRDAGHRLGRREGAARAAGRGADRRGAAAAAGLPRSRRQRRDSRDGVASRRADDDDDAGAAASGPRKPRLLLHAGLFLATFLTTTVTGAIQVHGGLVDRSDADGLSYSVPLMLILLCHELGHYIVARRSRRRRVAAVLHPAAARARPRDAGRRDRDARQRRTDRKQLIDVGAAGPLAGLAVAIPVLIVGLMHSDLVRAARSRRAAWRETRSSTRSLKRLIKGAWLPSSARRREPAPDGVRGLGGSAGHDDQPPADRTARRRARRDRLLRKPLRPLRERLRRLLPIMAIGGLLLGAARGARTRWAGAWDRARRRADRDERGDCSGWSGSCWSSLMRRMSGGVNHPPVDDEPLPREPAGAVLVDGRRVRGRVHAGADARQIPGRHADRGRPGDRGEPSSDEGPRVRDAARGDPGEPRTRCAGR